jgi:DNA-binding response OmpR family regulator
MADGGHRAIFPKERSFSLRCRIVAEMQHDMSTEQPLVFVVDDDASARDGIEDLLQSAGLSVMSFGSAQEFLKSPRPDAPGCIVLGVRLGLEFQKVLIEAGVLLPVIFITGHGDIPMSVMAMKSGAIEFLYEAASRAVAARLRQCWHRSRPLAAPRIEACFGTAAALRAIDAARTGNLRTRHHRRPEQANRSTTRVERDDGQGAPESDHQKDAGDLDRRPGPNGGPSRLLRRESQDLNQSTRCLVPTLGVGSTSAQLPPADRAFNMHSRIGGVNAEFGLNHRR